MGPNPLLPSEVREIAAQLCFPLSPWLCELIYRLDDAVLGARQKDGPSAGEAENPEVDARDTKSVRALLGGIAARIRLTNEAKAQAKALRSQPKP